MTEASLVLPTPTNPLVVLYRGHILSMKNQHTLRKNQKTGEVYGIGRSGEVRKFLTTWRQKIDEQLKSQGFDRIPRPIEVGCLVRIAVYAAPKADLPTADNDNMYTSIQETWQQALIDNDVQIADIHITRQIVREKAFEHAVGFLWVLDSKKLATDKDYALEELFRFYTEVYRGKRMTELLPDVRRAKAAF